MSLRVIVVLMSCQILSACTSLLPRVDIDTGGGFTSFEQAQAAAQRILPRKTRTEELSALGFDLPAAPNVTLIPYPDIVGRLAPHPGVPIELLDVGVRQCIEAQSDCRGYLLRFERMQRRREGNFWLDFLNMRRTTYYRGWWFETLIVIADNTVLFYNTAGQAQSERVERQVNPLGPFQSSGEGVVRELLR